MMEFTFEPTTLAAAPDLVKQFLAGLSSPIDSFLEDHIMASKIYRIVSGRRSLGGCAVFDPGLLTLFTVNKPDLAHGQRAFTAACRQLQVKQAFVSTGDELFLSHVLDGVGGGRPIVDLQAYFFEVGREIEPVHPSPINGKGLEIRAATAADQAEIERVSSGFFDRIREDIAEQKLYLFQNDSDLLAIGVIEPGRLLTTCASIGLFVHPDYRRQGIGRQVITHLIWRCREQGLKPIAGCWIHNEASKLTLESAGMVSGTRLLRLQFEIDPEIS